MAVYKKVPGCETVNISTLEFDTKPTPGSFNPVTSDGIAESVGNVAELVEKAEQDMKDMEEMLLANLPIAAKTLRFSFSKFDYSPVVAGVGSGGTWKKVNAKFNNVWDWTKSSTDWSASFNNSFVDSSNKVSVIAAGDTSSITSFFQLFRLCSSLIYCCLIDTSNATRMASMFSTTNIKKIPLFDTGKVNDVQYMFYNCVNVEEGSLALYQQMSTQTTPPSVVTSCFQYCGKDTTTGAAELAQIPASWGGTGPEPSEG